MHQLPKLPYNYNALEPNIDTLTMEIHHDKHHQTYVNKLNEALENYPELQKKTVEELLHMIDVIPQDIRTAVKNNGGGHYNHTFFWDIMGPNAGGEPTGMAAQEISKNFGNFKTFKEKFTEAATKLFGSGWVWLSKDKEGKLKIVSTQGHDNPLMVNEQPLLVIDCWEHAYYLKYQNRRADYIAAWWNTINWEKVEEKLEAKDY